MIKIPQYYEKREPWPHISKLTLADPDYSSPGNINLIIGADYYGSVIKHILIKGEASMPIAQQTIFGWVLSGPTSLEVDTTMDRKTYHCSIDHDLQELIQKFWNQKEIQITEKATRSSDEEACEKHFLTTHTRDNTGRYVVRFPIKGDLTKLGDSKGKAFCCLNRLNQRFSKDPEYKRLYVDFINKYLNLGHMVLAKTLEEHQTPSYYLAHHGVVREESRTTKLRVVFNGSGLTTLKHSLNDFLYIGEKLQNDITEILIWIQTHRILFSTDVEKMFRQINLHQADWNLQRILWQKSNNDINVYELTTVMYGLNCALLLALRTIQKFIKDERHKYPLAIQPITKGRYVDDVFGGAETSNETRAIIDEVIQLCSAGKFSLQKWSSNCPVVTRPWQQQGRAREGTGRVNNQRRSDLPIAESADRSTPCIFSHRQ
ncbi:uncharacterized protein [Cardiocondyla obscurior]|uniref:uncharacterized protein n=1 Tax=Cardiocondyla obscurior TaxID=286306 RepID=UPI0039658C5A